MAEHRRITYDELMDELTERFGANPMDFAFQCPACEDVATARDFQEALDASPREDRKGRPITGTDIIGQECIGRTLGALGNENWAGRGCNWAAYGFLPGPWTVDLEDGSKLSLFPIAPPPKEIPVV